jgi:hypothetical protein
MAGMEARRAAGAELEAAWQLVLKRRDVRGEAKLAWLYLAKTGGLGTTQTVNAALVGADQGGDQRAGLRALTALAVAGLIEVNDRDRRGGVWTFYLFNPSDVQRGASALKRLAHGDHQHELFEPGETGIGGDHCPEDSDQGRAAEVATAEVVQHPPRAPIGSIGISKDLSKPSPLVPSEPLEGAAAGQRTSDGSRWRTPRGGSGATSAVGNRELHSLAALMAAVTGRFPSPAEKQAWVDQLVEHMLARLDDPGTRVSPLLTIAWAIVEGQVRLVELDRALARIDELRSAGQITNSAGAILVRRMQNLFYRLGIDWSRPPAAATRGGGFAARLSSPKSGEKG